MLAEGRLGVPVRAEGAAIETGTEGTASRVAQSGPGRAFSGAPGQIVAASRPDLLSLSPAFLVADAISDRE